MTKQEALLRTKNKFTNLMDGKVIPNVGVNTIIEYYESLLIDKKLVVKYTSNIENSFQEEENQAFLDDFYDEFY